MHDFSRADYPKASSTRASIIIAYL